jgi:hypothetical protein
MIETPSDPHDASTILNSTYLVKDRWLRCAPTIVGRRRGGMLRLIMCLNTRIG